MLKIFHFVFEYFLLMFKDHKFIWTSLNQASNQEIIMIIFKPLNVLFLCKLKTLICLERRSSSYCFDLEEGKGEYVQKFDEFETKFFMLRYSSAWSNFK